MELREQVERIRSREDLVEFIHVLRADLLADPDAWENPSLARFLEALAAWTTDMHGYYLNTGQEVPRQPSWKVLGRCSWPRRCTSDVRGLMNETRGLEQQVWVFSGEGGSFPSGVFRTKESAEAWVAKHQLSGVLTRYPLDTGVYDWAVAHNLFQPKRAEHASASFIQAFSSARQEHFHYEQGSSTQARDAKRS